MREKTANGIKPASALVGAIAGDVIGSRFEFHPKRSKQFALFAKESIFTDDTVMSVAVAEALQTWRQNGGDLHLIAIASMKVFAETVEEYGIDAGYGGMFRQWLASENPRPYNSWGNGSAMRVSAAGIVAKSLEEAEELAKTVSEISHNHPYGITGAQMVAAAVWQILYGGMTDKSELREWLSGRYWPLDFTLEEIRPAYGFDESCQGTVPQSLVCFFEADSYEDTIRNAISLGGDADTMGAIAGAVAGAYYGVPQTIADTALSLLVPELRAAVRSFCEFVES